MTAFVWHSLVEDGELAICRMSALDWHYITRLSGLVPKTMRSPRRVGIKPRRVVRHPKDTGNQQSFRGPPIETETMTAVRVLLADDHPLLLAGFTTALADLGIEVVAQTRTPQEAIAKFETLRPDVLVIDIRFGDQLTGFDAARDILAQFPEARVVFLSQFDQDSLIKEAYRLGGLAFVSKGADPECLAAAIKRAALGQPYFLPQIAERLAHLAIAGDTSPLTTLDAREIEVFKLMAQGHTQPEIARALNLSPKTISNTSLAIKERLGIHRPADITRLAVRHGLIEA